MRKQHQARASVLNEVSSTKGGSLFVLASASNGVPEYQPKSEIASCKCGKCGFKFGTVAALSEPYCPNCGSGEVKASASPVQALPKTDEQISWATCAGCGTHNIIHDVTAKAMDGNIHCVTCGTSINYEVAEADENGVTDPITLDNEDEGDIRDVEAGTDDYADDHEVAVEPLSGAEETDVKKTIPNSEAAADQGQQQDDLGDDVLDSEDLTEEDFGQEQQASDQQLEGGDQDLGEQEQQDACNSSVQMSLLDVVAAHGDVDLSLASVGESVVAMVGDVIVARLSAEAAGDNAEHMHRASFHQAVKHTASSMGAKKALAHYGFSPVVIAFPQRAVINRVVAKRVAAAQARLEAETAAMRTSFLQCMSIAAAGLNKGFFAKYENALKRGFGDYMQAAGVQSPGKLVDKVFATFGDQYHRTLLTIANDLMGKPLEVRNSMAEAVQAAGYVSAAEDQQDEEQDQEQDQQGDQLESRLESASVRVTRSSAKPASTSVREIRASVGGKLF